MRRRTPIRVKSNNIGRKIRLARSRTGLTQAALADKIRSQGGSRSEYKSSTLKQLISRLERGEPIPYPDHVMKSLNEILGLLDADAGEPTDVIIHRSRPVAIDIS